MAIRKLSNEKDLEMLPISKVMGKLFESKEFQEKYSDFKIMQLWTEIARQQCSELMAKKTRARMINKKRELVVSIHAAVLANELQFVKESLKVAMNQAIKERFPAKPQLKDIVFEMRG